MKENLKKFAVWLLAVAAVMAFYTYSFQREFRYTLTDSFQGVILEVYPEEDRVVVEEVTETEESNPRKQSVLTDDADQFQVGDAVKVSRFERRNVRNTGMSGEAKVEIEKVK